MIQKFLILFVLCFILYFPSLQGPFTFDDQAILLYNPLVQHLSQGFSGIVDVWNFQHSRFLTNLTIAFNYYLHGFNVLGYHLVNVLIHLVATVGVWFLTRLILDLKGEKKLKIDVAFWAAVLFLVHPLHTESVSYLNQRSSALVSLFYLWSVVFYIQSAIAKNHSKKVSNLVCAIVFALFAILSKETAVTLPLAWILIDQFVVGRKSSRWLWGMIFFMIISVALFFDFQFKSFLSDSVYSQSHQHEFLTLGTYLLTQLQVLVVFVRLIFIPLGLNLDYDFAMAHSLFEPMTFCALIFLSTLIYIGWVVRKSHWYISFGIFWFFISLLSHVFPPRANVIAEHKLYLTLTLLVPVMVYACYKALSSRAFIIVMSLICCCFFLLTFQRNILWSDPVLIWQDTVSKSPKKARVYLNLGVSYLKKGLLDQALEAYQKAIELDPLVPDAYIGVSQIYAQKGNLEQSDIYAHKAVEIAPDFSLSYVQRGVILARQEKYTLALNDFSQSILLNPDDIQVYKMRGMVYLQIKNDEQAINDFDVWLKHNPQDIDILSKRADIYFRHKKYQLALQDYNQLIKLTSFAPYYYNRSVLYEILGDKIHMQEDRQIARNLGFK